MSTTTRLSTRLAPRALALATTAVLTLVLWCAPARAQQVELQASTTDVYAGVPFDLSVIATGFDENPEPSVVGMDIAGATVTSMGTRPNVSQRVTIINGRRDESRTVTWVHTFRVEPQAPGDYTIPSVTVTQGVTSAASQPAQFRAEAVERTDDMRIEMTFPERRIRVGESFDVFVDWYIRRNVQGQTLSVPAFDVPDWLHVEAPENTSGGRRREIELQTRSGPLSLPFEQSNAQLDGQTFTRLRIQARATPQRAGRLALDPVRVTADLEVGQGRDRMGFPTRRTKKFEAVGQPRTLQIEELPTAGRPESFTNAVGTRFDIEVEADRTVVAVGDPITLTVTIRGDGEMNGLILPSLSADGGLSPDRFSLPSTAPPGVIVESASADLTAKRFEVVARLRDERVTEIPPLAFSWFDPEKEQYQTVRSKPIALSVAGANRVSAADVVSASTGSGAESGGRSGGGVREVSLVGADMGLSDPAAALSAPTKLDDIKGLLLALYALPLVVFGLVVWRRRRASTAGDRAHAQALDREIESALSAARQQPAIDAAPALGNVLRRLAREASAEVPGELRPDDLIERLDVVAYSPRASDAPLDEALVEQVRERAHALRALRTEAPSRRGAASSGVTVVLALAVGLGAAAAAPGEARAADLDAARAAYAEALGEQQRATRTAAFARAASLLGEVAAEHPDSPELLVDLGNASLGAADVGRAVLAYRRALVLDDRNPRAQRNLSWVRESMPDWVPRPEVTDETSDSMWIWNRWFSPVTVALLGVGAFAVFVLLWAPWGGSRSLRNARRLFSVLPLVLWLWLGASLWSTPDPGHDAVVVLDGMLLRSADNVGASPVLAEPLPPGTEVQVIEERGNWRRIELSDGASGWIQTSAVELVQRPG